MTLLHRIPLLRRALAFIGRRRISATLEVTTIFPCANSCRFCPQDKWRKAYKGTKTLTYQDFCKVLENVPKHVRIDFSGFSEPFMNRDASLMMQHAYQKGYQVSLFTTLVGITQNDLELLKGVHFAACNIHVPDSKNFVVRDEDWWLESYKLFVNKVPYANAVYHLGSLSEKLRKEVAKAQRYPSLTRANNVNPEVTKHLTRHRGTINCSTSGDTFKQNVMMPNGDVYICCMDWSLQHRLGNLLSQPYETLHQSDEYHKICRSMIDESIESICRYCERSKSHLYKL